MKLRLVKPFLEDIDLSCVTFVVVGEGEIDCGRLVDFKLAQALNLQC